MMGQDMPPELRNFLEQRKGPAMPQANVKPAALADAWEEAPFYSERERAAFEEAAR